MSIKAYVGRMGSGKSYEVVTEVILGALRRGRRVVSNIAGLNYDEMKAVLIAEGIPEESIGTIAQVEHEQVRDAFFWRADFQKKGDWDAFRKYLFQTTEKDQHEAISQRIESRTFYIQPGDLVALDEIWRFWNGFATKDDEGNKRPSTVMNFFRMHRHFTHPETGVACDVALITQDVMDISRQVRAVIEETYYMEKLTAIGSSNRYRVDIHQGGKISRRPLRSLQRSYNPDLFKLYSSHSQKKEGDAEAREENIDKRGNILQGALFKFILPVGVVVAGFAIYTVYGFLHPAEKSPDKISASDKSSGVNQSAKISHAKRDNDMPDVSPDWRVVGWINGEQMRVILSNGNAQRIIEPPAWKMTGVALETFLPSGEAVTPWTGSSRSGLIDQAAGQGPR